MNNKPWYTNVDILGDNVLVREIDANGQKNSFKIKNYRPTLYLESKDQTAKYSSIYGVPLESIQPGTIKETKEFIDRYQSMNNFNIYGIEKFAYQYISDEYPGVVEYDYSKLTIVNLDIETESENCFADPENPTESINLITVKYNGKLVTLGCKPCNTKKSQYIHCSDERDMLNTFLMMWKKLDPDIVTGWNVQGYDIPYIYNRIRLLFDEKTANKMSPWGWVRPINATRMNQQRTIYKLYGISTLDYLDLYKKYTYTSRESYTLGYIASLELGETKTNFKDEYDTLKELYNNDWEKYVEYNINDVDLVDKLETKLGFLNLHLMVSYIAKVNYEDAFSAVRTWDVLIYNWLKERNKIIPLKDYNDGGDFSGQFEGAYVKAPTPGLYKSVVSFDVASMYPNVLRTWNISPETFIEKQTINFDRVLVLKEPIGSTKKTQEYCVAANGATYDTSKKGFIAELAGEMFDRRKQYKKKMLAAERAGEDDKMVLFDKKQQALKILVNSLYGKIGCPYSRFYDVYNAEAVTKTGQFIIRFVANKINEWMNKQLNTVNPKDYIIASDTDSVYINFGELVDKVYANKTYTDNEHVEFLDKVCQKKLEQYIADCFTELTAYCKCKDNYMAMARDTICNKGIFLAKKRYILNMMDKEGIRYDKPKLKIMGLETQRSSTPQVCRDALKEVIAVIINQDEAKMRQFVVDFKQKYIKMPVEKIARPSGVNGMEKYGDGEKIYIKGSPIHVKGSLIYNDFVQRNGLSNKYSYIMNKSKIKFVYLKEPNLLKSPVIAFINELPDEMKLDTCIDREKQFEKTFLEPLTNICKCINWSIDPKATLECLFL